MAAGTCEWGGAGRVRLKSDKAVVVENRADWGKGDWAEVDQMQAGHYGGGENGCGEVGVMEAERQSGSKWEE